MIHGIIFDFNRTLYDPLKEALGLGCLTVLTDLKNDSFRLCLLSKKTRPDRREQITALGLDPYFVDIQVIEGDKTIEHFKQCMAAMELLSENIAVVGDRVRGEIILGNQLGMFTIWYKVGKFATELPETESQEPCAIITDLSAVRECVTKDA